MRIGRGMQRLNQLWFELSERRLRRRGAQPAHPLRLPAGDALMDRIAAIGLRNARRGFQRDQFIEDARNLPRQRLQFGQERRPVVQPVELRHAIERRTIGKDMRLPVVDHLHTMLDRPQAGVGPGENIGGLAVQMAGLGQRAQSAARIANSQVRIAATVDELKRLGGKLDLANPAAPLLQIVSGARFERAAIAIADAERQGADGLDRAEIQAAAPYEAANAVQECLPRRNVPSAGSGADEGGPLPCQRARFVMRCRRARGNGERADFGSGSQTQVDAKDVALARLVRQQADDLAGVALRRLGRFVALAARQARRIVKENGIDVGAVIQLPRPVLAQRQRDEAVMARPFADSPRDGRADGGMQGAVGKRAEFAHHPRKIESIRQVADRQHEAERLLLQPKRHAGVRRRQPCQLGLAQGLLALSRRQQLGQLGRTLQQARKIRRMRARSCEGRSPVRCHRALLCLSGPCPARLPPRISVTNRHSFRELP